MCRITPFLFLVASLTFLTEASFGVTLTQKGCFISHPSIGGITLGFPELTVGNGAEKAHKVELHNKKKATVHYKSGTKLTVTVKGHDARFSFSNLPSNFSKFKSSMLLPFPLKDGGTWKSDSSKGEFPAELPSKPQFYSGHTKGLRVSGVDGTTAYFRFPAHSYVQLQDNRAWGWNVFGGTAFIPFNKDNPNYNFTIGIDKSDTKRVILMDRFGQNERKDFPDKVQTEEELKKDLTDIAAYFKGMTPHANLDTYGGLKGTGKKLGLKATGFFHTEKVDGRWVMVNPMGNAFFQLGICGFGPCDDYTYVEGREQVFEWIPPRDETFKSAWRPSGWWSTRAVSFYIANIIRKYGSWDVDEHMVRQIKRARKMGFNSHGAWSHTSDETKKLNWPYTRFLPNPKAIPGIRGVWDPFDQKNKEYIAQKYAKHLPERANDPLIIGYFIANEQAFEDIPRRVPALDETFACKKEFIAWLKKRYGTIDAFNKAWSLQEKSFASATSTGLPIRTKAAHKDAHEFTGIFIDTYYKIINDNFRKHVPNHMLIGNRWQPGTAGSEQLVTVAGKYLDVVSVNYYTYGIDKDFTDRIYKWSNGKPQLWSEYHYCSGKDSGVPGRVDVGSQKMRGLAYRYYNETAASLGYVVGTQWFIWVDQPLTGRWFSKYNGENYNIGIVSVADRPYRPMVDEIVKTNNGAIYDVYINGAQPFVLDDPRFNNESKGEVARQIVVPRMSETNKIDGQLEGWPNIPPERIGAGQLVLGSDAGGVEANFKLAYDDTNLYLFVQARDTTPLNPADKPANFWAGDCIELFVSDQNLGKRGQLGFGDHQVLLSVSEKGGWYYPHADKQPTDVHTIIVPTPDGKGYILEAAISWASLNITPKLGKEIMFDLGIDDNDGTKRQRQLMWNGKGNNSRERSNWGRALLSR